MICPHWLSSILYGRLARFLSAHTCCQFMRGSYRRTFPVASRIPKRRKHPGASLRCDPSVALRKKITMPVWSTPKKLYDAKLAVFSMSKKFATTEDEGRPHFFNHPQVHQPDFTAAGQAFPPRPAFGKSPAQFPQCRRRSAAHRSVQPEWPPVFDRRAGPVSDIAPVVPRAAASQTVPEWPQPSS